MTRAALTLELLAVLAFACERHESEPARPAEPDGSIHLTEPELNDTQLEDELNRLEREIKKGKQITDAAVPHEEPDREPPKAAPSSQRAPSRRAR